MLLQTKENGLIEISDEQLITIPNGLLGFESYSDYALIDSHYRPFVWLQSTNEQKLAFLMIDPFLVCPEYSPEIDDLELQKIDIKDPAQILVMTLVTIPKDGKTVTTNLLGPLIINKKNHKAMQVVLADDKWGTKYNIIEALKKKEAI